LRGAEDGDKQQNNHLLLLRLLRSLTKLKLELTTCYAENPGLSTAYLRLENVRFPLCPPDLIR